MKKLPVETPVYLFLGFLESGKTKFIQETLEDPRFSSGEKTLLLVCEEGEEEYETIRFSNAESVELVVIDDTQVRRRTRRGGVQRYVGVERFFQRHARRLDDQSAHDLLRFAHLPQLQREYASARLR